MNCVVARSSGGVVPAFRGPVQRSLALVEGGQQVPHVFFLRILASDSAEHSRGSRAALPADGCLDPGAA